MTRMRRLMAMALLVPAVGCARYAKGLAAYQENEFELALRQWRSLARRGNVEAQYHVGQMYSVGQGVEKDEAQAVRWYREAAVRGHEGAQSRLAYLYLSSLGHPEQDPRAEEWLA